MSIAETYAKLKRSASIRYPGNHGGCLVRESDIVEAIGTDGLQLMLDHHLVIPYGDANSHPLYLLSA